VVVTAAQIHATEVSGAINDCQDALNPWHNKKKEEIFTDFLNYLNISMEQSPSEGGRHSAGKEFPQPSRQPKGPLSRKQSRATTLREHPPPTRAISQ
jgi:hypothetical protein